MTIDWSEMGLDMAQTMDPDQIEDIVTQISRKMEGIKVNIQSRASHECMMDG
jgi:C-terminal processing protease CtpA/Prc